MEGVLVGGISGTLGEGGQEWIRDKCLRGDRG